MDWIQFILFVLALAGMYWSLKSDFQRDRDRTYEDRKDLLNIIRNSEKDSKEFKEKSEREWKAYREQMAQFREQMAQESRDFHGRMCTLEERYLQILQNRIKGA